MNVSSDNNMLSLFSENGLTIVDEDQSFELTNSNGDIEIASASSPTNLIINDIDGLDTSGGMAVAESSTNDSVGYAIDSSNDESIVVHSVLMDNTAPEEYSYTFPDLDMIILDETTGQAVFFVFDGTEYQPVGGVDTPWAVDANGRRVPTHFEVDGNTLIQHVDHHSEEFTYPVTADPKWWDNVKAWFRNTSQAVTNKAKSAANWLGKKSTWLRGKTWSGVKAAGKGVKVAAKKVGPGAVVLCAIGAGWAWYRSDAKGWVRVGDAVAGCFL